MKKFLTLMALLVAFVSTSFAQSYYVVGNLTSWTYQPGNDGIAPMALLDGTTDSYYADFAPTGGGTMYFCIADGNGNSWDNFNYNHRYSASTANYSVTDGVENLQLSINGDRSLTLAADGSNYRIIFNATSHQLTVVKSGTAQNAEITQVDLRGEFNNWSENDDYKFVKGDGDVYTLTLDLSSDMLDKAFKLVVNGEWLGYQSDMTIDVPDGWIEDGGGNDHNIILKNSITGYKTYTFTATWEANPSATSGWTLKIEGKDVRVAEISSVLIHGAFASDTQWEHDLALPLTGSENVYSQTVPLTTTLQDLVFELQVNGQNVRFNDVTIDPESATGLLVDGGGNEHFILFKNSISGYDTYLATATWTPGPDATKGWRLKVVGVHERTLDYAIVGDLTGGWPATTDDDGSKDVSMTAQNNGLYTLVVNEFAAEANTTYEYKLRTNKMWNLFDLPGNGNASWTPTEAGNYKLTFVANVTGTAITDDTFGEIAAYTVTVVSEKIIVPITAYYIVTKGDNNVWTTKAQMTENEGVFTYTFTGKYNQGVIFNIVPNTALNNDLTQVDTWDDVYVPVSSGNYWVEFKDYPEISLEKTSNIVGFIFKASGATTTITYNPAQNVDKIAITNTAEATVSEAGYATYSNSWDYKVVGNGLKVYVVKGVADGEADMVELAAGAGIPAYTGVVIEADAGSYTVTPAEEATADVTGNLLVGSGDYVYGISGDFGQGANPRYYTAYILAKKGTDVGFYKFDSSDGIVLDPHKAFLAVPKNGDSDAPAFIGFGDTTGIVNVNRATITNNQYYTLDGRRVENPTKGLYIVNGKKVVIK